VNESRARQPARHQLLGPHTLIPCQPSPGRPRLAAQAADRGPYFPTGKTKTWKAT